MTTFELGPAHAGAHPLDNQVAFQFSNGADNRYDRPTQRAAGIDLFSETDKLDLEMIEFVQHLKLIFYSSRRKASVTP